MSGRDVIRLGLVGAGRWGRNYIRTIAGLDGVTLARLVSGNPASRDLVNADCIVSSTWREAIAPDDLDGLIVATPPAVQCEIAAAAIAAGLPLMLEKPVATDVAEAKRLMDMARRADVPVLVDHVYLFHPAFAALKSEAERLGGLRSIRASRGGWGPFRPETRALWDWAPHDIAMCIDLAGTAPERITASLLKAERTADGDGETVRLDLLFPSGVEAEITVGNLMEPPARLFTAVCDSGELIFDDLADDKLVRRMEAGDKAVPVAGDPPLTCAVAAFAHGIAGGDRPAFGLDLAVEVTRAISEVESRIGPRNA